MSFCGVCPRDDGFRTDYPTAVKGRKSTKQSPTKQIKRNEASTARAFKALARSAVNLLMARDPLNRTHGWPLPNQERGGEENKQNNDEGACVDCGCDGCCGGD